jgi:hypothetical protein
MNKLQRVRTSIERSADMLRLMSASEATKGRLLSAQQELRHAMMVIDEILGNEHLVTKFTTEDRVRTL